MSPATAGRRKRQQNYDNNIAAASETYQYWILVEAPQDPEFYPGNIEHDGDLQHLCQYTYDFNIVS
jgi:hypothetical protein